ncbi:30S ribosomal protein S2 [archaeon]|jgi:small subunit ribosomal protein S2|nr:30S ribosomal protein S2 [archaeon]MBT6823910.1 30S ribosomal protein S2 [archaeon]MBT7106796.1 30S ribosomal protein S2 [archaeon]MBT7297284.1 30S ribosomal protein S2 [archaeon]
MAEENYMVPLDKYLEAGIHIGTKTRTNAMSKFIYKVRSDGLSVLNVEEIDNRIRIASKMISNYESGQILVACRRENGWKAAKLFGKLTGANVFIGRYPPGTLTNVDLEDFVEAKLIISVDPIPDKNVIDDAKRLGVPVIALCDTNNETSYIDLVVPCNNKGKKSLGIIFWIFAKEFLKAKGIIKSDEDISKTMDDFTSI